MREAASLRGRVILTVRARRFVSCKSVPTLLRECGDIGPDVPFRHPLRRGHRRHPLSSRSPKAPGRRDSGGRPRAGSVQKFAALPRRHLQAIPRPRRWHREQAPLPAP